MDKILIRGGHALSGDIAVSGAKNHALPLMAMALLTPETITLENVPSLRDIATMKKLLTGFGAEVTGPDAGRMAITAKDLRDTDAPYDLVRTMRASVLVLGPLIARRKKARVSLPGGCAIGSRPINLHLKGLTALGAEVRVRGGYVEAAAPRLRGADIYFDIPTVTGTENLMMAASLAEGVTTLRNSAREPEISAMADALNAMGARISGAGTETITIEGVSSLSGTNHRIIPDRIETGTYLIAAAITGGRLRLQRCHPGHLDAVIAKLRDTGTRVEVDHDTMTVTGARRPSPVDITTLPYPGFPTDLQAQMMSLLCLASGSSAITETVFENRFIHVAELRRLGGQVQIEGNTALIRGAEELVGAPVMATDLRASASLVLAGLAARGETEVSRVYHLDRGYEMLVEKLRGAGADIERART